MFLPLPGFKQPEWSPCTRNQVYQIEIAAEVIPLALLVDHMVVYLAHYCVVALPSDIHGPH